MKPQFAIASSLLAALAADAAGLDRQELAKRLQALEVAPPPTQLAPGAMCYKVAGPPERVEYTCLKCGEKTLYSRAENRGGVIHTLTMLDTFRRLTRQIKDKGLDCRLDETAFCKKCAGGAKEPLFVLETRWPGEKEPHRATLNGSDDLKLILELIEGKTKHAGIADWERPMKDYLPRLRELLGVKSGAAVENKP